MIFGSWEPTVILRQLLKKNGGLTLQQQWIRQTITYHSCYGGRDRRVEGSESEWRDIPLETET